MRFGILSTATIARRNLVPAIRNAGHDIVAISSRSETKAQSVADKLDIPEAYGDYEALLSDADIDAVYVPLPNSEHLEWTKRAADHGLHVLCEKPLGVTAGEAREMGEYCEERGVTLMEALMYMYHPRTERIGEIVRTELGEIRSAKATFHSSLDSWPAGTRLDPDLGGGSVLDVGPYVISAARMFLGEPETVFARAADLENSGVDTQMTGMLHYANDATATISTSFDTLDTQYYHVEGTRGWLLARPSFAVASNVELSVDYRTGDRDVTEKFIPVDHYELEVKHFVDCVENRKTPRTDWREAARTLAIADALRESAETGEMMPVESF